MNSTGMQAIVRLGGVSWPQIDTRRTSGSDISIVCSSFQDIFWKHISDDICLCMMVMNLLGVYEPGAVSYSQIV